MLERVSPAEYSLEFFRREGFVRRRCKVCGEYFWTKNPEQEVCNDAPCVEYFFWDLPRPRRVLSVSEARKLFLDFFRRHGHEVVPPRPVVARWREDLYLTIASIVVFQPHVTKGIAPPPANPLVISQPCIRLEDIDNVGLTIGRHLTSFEMGGHHAFNYPDKRVYWKEETVEYAYKFFVEELGVPEDQIAFKESWWEGGGNAGPSFEVAVGGLELATLVFMAYEVADGGYREMKLKVVDTGYGIERIAWFTQRTPTAFHAIYGSLVDEFHKRLGVPQPEKTLLETAARKAGRLDPEDPASIARYYASVASALGLPERDVREQLVTAARVYTLLDHTKTIALMLGDGIVPSNTGEGYLARLVIRRAIRTLKLLGADTGLAELVRLQIGYWAKDYYPQMERNRDYILEVVGREEERYEKTLSLGVAYVEKMLKKKKSITVEDLVELYDSHGVPPDIVAEIAARHGARVEVPHDFYSLVAKRHGASSGPVREAVEKPRLPADIVEWAKKLPPTRRLFHEDPYRREFTAKPIAGKGKYLVLDATAFYPLGGGQYHDTGLIEACGHSYKVVFVDKVDDTIVHVLDKPFDNKCDSVRGVIDWQRRYRLMRHHTAVHVLLGTLRKLLGDHVWQAGAEKTPEKARLDVTHYEQPPPSLVDKIEQEINKVILERIPVHTKIMDRNEAEEKYGYRIYQGGAPLTARLRIVEIPGVDVEACFGTHVANTAEIGGVKITNVEKIQDGVIRFELVAGTEVANYAKKLEQTLEEAAKTIGAEPAELPKRLARITERLEELKRAYSTARAALLEVTYRRVRENPQRLDNINLYIIDDPLPDDESYRELLKKLSSEDPRAVVIAVYTKGQRTIIEASKGSSVETDLRSFVKALQKRIQGVRGGGKPDHVTAAVPKLRRDELLATVKEAIHEATGEKPREKNTSS